MTANPVSRTLAMRQWGFDGLIDTDLTSPLATTTEGYEKEKPRINGCKSRGSAEVPSMRLCARF
jgi:hypothetical protein